MPLDWKLRTPAHPLFHTPLFVMQLEFSEINEQIGTKSETGGPEIVSGTKLNVSVQKWPNKKFHGGLKNHFLKVIIGDSLLSTLFFSV